MKELTCEAILKDKPKEMNPEEFERESMKCFAEGFNTALKTWEHEIKRGMR